MKRYKVISNFEWADQFIKVGKIIKYDKYFNAFIYSSRSFTFVFTSRDIENLLEERIIEKIENDDFKI